MMVEATIMLMMMAMRMRMKRSGWGPGDRGSARKGWIMCREVRDWQSRETSESQVRGWIAGTVKRDDVPVREGGPNWKDETAEADQ